MHDSNNMKILHLVRYIEDDSAEIEASLSQDKSKGLQDVQLLLTLAKGQPVKCQWSLTYTEEKGPVGLSLPAIHGIVSDYVEHLKMTINDGFINKVLAKDGLNTIKDGFVGLGLKEQLRKEYCHAG